ncbi:hypothetical protein KY336_01200 [Candidatus Woesearchaeota archaeon]|nr:hypothetical protein [Candidatus Woesearchaeota archaeon]
MEEMYHRLIIGKYKHNINGTFYVGFYIKKDSEDESKVHGRTIEEFLKALPANYKFAPVKANCRLCNDYAGLEAISKKEFELLKEAIICRNKGVLRFPKEKRKKG